MFMNNTILLLVIYV